MFNPIQTLATPWHNRRYVGRHRADELVAAPRNGSSRWLGTLPIAALVRGTGTVTAPTGEASPSATGE
jgi:hypothetical protein